jgi:carbon monoxide dehydrogenase subunit G
MAIQTKHQFEIDAPLQEVWAYFSDPPQVVPCLVGAELTEVLGEGKYRGEVGFRFGQIKAHFSGTVEIVEKDDANFTMSLRAKGAQQGAVSQAEAAILFACQETGSGRTLVSATFDVLISGRLAQLGGSMIQRVAKFMFDRFAQCVQAELAHEN